MPISHLLLIVLINLIWGINFIFTKLVFDQLPPVLFAAMRFAVILIILLPLLRPARGQMRLILLTSLCMGALHFTLIYLGLQRANGVSSVAIASQLFVPFSTVLSVLLLRERIGWRRILGISLAFGGVLIIGFDPAALNQLDSLAFVAVGALIAALGAIFMKRIKDVGVFQLQAWMAAVSAPILFLSSAVLETGQWTALTGADSTAWGILVFSALGASLLGHGGMYWLLQRHDVSLISPTTLLSTVFGVALGIVFLGEVLTTRMLIGGLLALGGVLMIALRQPRRGPPPVLSQTTVVPTRSSDQTP